MLHDSIDTRSRRSLFIAALVGVGFCGAIGYSIKNAMDQNQKIRSLEKTIGRLQESLEAKERELNDARLRGRDQGNNTSSRRLEPNHAEAVGDKTGSGQSITGNAPGSLQILKDLETVTETDTRSYLEKLQDLLSGNPTEEEVAIASRFIFEKARDQQGLPDYALQSIYASQSNADLRRVIAQVLSQRGNNTLLNNQIAEAQARLTSAQPGVRREALSQLAKMHSTKSVDAIAPLLQDPDTTVRLEALFALRDSGNQQHVHLAEAMINDPDPSVRTLAGDVSSSLKNLSSNARTGYSRSEIEAELPPIANP